MSYHRGAENEKKLCNWAELRCSCEKSRSAELTFGGAATSVQKFSSAWHFPSPRVSSTLSFFFFALDWSDHPPPTSQVRTLLAFWGFCL